MNKIEYALESFKNIQDLIKFIDQKSSIVIVIAGLVFTGYVEFVKKLQLAIFNQVSLIGVITFISSTITLITLVYVIYLSIFKILKPRLAKNYSEDEFSLFYFEHISALGRQGINNQYELLTEDYMLKSIIDQQYEISKILEQKTIKLGISFKYLFVSIVSLIIFIISSTQL